MYGCRERGYRLGEPPAADPFGNMIAAAQNTSTVQALNLAGHDSELRQAPTYPCERLRIAAWTMINTPVTRTPKNKTVGYLKKSDS
jgi:hypothetical protein